MFEWHHLTEEFFNGICMQFIVQKCRKTKIKDLTITEATQADLGVNDSAIK